MREWRKGNSDMRENEKMIEAVRREIKAGKKIWAWSRDLNSDQRRAGEETKFRRDSRYFVF